MYWPNCGGGTFQSSRASPATRLQFQFSRAGLRFPFWHKFQFSPDAGAWWLVLTILFPPQSSSFQSSRTVLCGWGCSFLVRSFSILTRAFPDAAVCQQFSFNPHALWQRVRRSWLGASSTTRFTHHAPWAGAPAQTGQTLARFQPPRVFEVKYVNTLKFQSSHVGVRALQGCRFQWPFGTCFNPHALSRAGALFLTGHVNCPSVSTLTRFQSGCAVSDRIYVNQTKNDSKFQSSHSGKRVRQPDRWVAVSGWCVSVFGLPGRAPACTTGFQSSRRAGARRFPFQALTWLV